MKRLRLTLGLSTFLVVICAFLSVGLVVSHLTSQAQEITGEKQKGNKSQIKINWEPTYYPISGSDSKVELNLPDVLTDSNLIVGIQKTKKGEPEAIAVAVVEWRELENFSQGLDFKPKVISAITNLSPDAINLSAGRIELMNAVESDKSLLIHLKVNPKTYVRLKKGSKDFVRKVQTSDEIYHKGEVLDVANSEIPLLLNRLSMSKFLQNQANK